MAIEGKNMGKVYAIYDGEYPEHGCELIRVEDENQIYKIAHQSSILFYGETISVIRERLMLIQLEYLDNCKDLASPEAIKTLSKHGWQIPDGVSIINTEA